MFDSINGIINWKLVKSDSSEGNSHNLLKFEIEGFTRAGAGDLSVDLGRMTIRIDCPIAPLQGPIVSQLPPSTLRCSKSVDRASAGSLPLLVHICRAPKLHPARHRVILLGTSSAALQLTWTRAVLYSFLIAPYRYS